MGSNSILTERCLRELYLKGFEIAVREARPRAIMNKLQPDQRRACGQLL